MEMETKTQDPIVLVVDFHHSRGPEIEFCFAADGSDPVTENDWSLLPFMALSDGAHASLEDFSYFTLRKQATHGQPATSLFGIACSQQLEAAALKNRPPEVTRSTVQKAVVIIVSEPRHFGLLRERLSVVTGAWFAQRDFTDTEILKRFHESLITSFGRGDSHREANIGLSLRELIREFKYQSLVLFKCLLLQPKMLFYGSKCERLCMAQFSLVSLIPGLIYHLQDCADPAFDSYAKNAVKPSSLKTSDRDSLLAYMGLPLQLFGKGSMFGPYTPLQHLDLLADYGTKSYVVGSTNSLLLQQRDRYSDILINLDDITVNVTSPSLRSALQLSAADRRWIDFLMQTISDTWDDAHPERPKAHGYLGSDEFIRLQFEEYLLALLSCMKYHQGLKNNSLQNTDIEGDPALDYNNDFLERWQRTPNFALFNRLTSDSLLFSVVEPRHPCSGGLGLEDIQRRIAQQMADMHLDERVRESREALGKHLATGHKKVTSVFNSFWADFEARRDSSKRKNEEKTYQQLNRHEDLWSADGELQSSRPSTTSSNHLEIPESSSSSAASWSLMGAPSATAASQSSTAPSLTTTYNTNPAVSMTAASVASASQRASAYLASWGSWASDKRREWQERQERKAAVGSATPILSSNSSVDGSRSRPDAVSADTDASSHHVTHAKVKNEHSDAGSLPSPPRSGSATPVPETLRGRDAVEKPTTDANGNNTNGNSSSKKTMLTKAQESLSRSHSRSHSRHSSRSSNSNSNGNNDSNGMSANGSRRKRFSDFLHSHSHSHSQSHSRSRSRRSLGAESSGNDNDCDDSRDHSASADAEKGADREHDENSDVRGNGDGDTTERGNSTDGDIDLRDETAAAVTEKEK